MWLPLLTMLVGVLCIVFPRRLGRDAVRQRKGTRFTPPEAMIVASRRKLEEDWYGWVFAGFGVLLTLSSLWILLRAYNASN
jgi:hypothetical protein